MKIVSVLTGLLLLVSSIGGGVWLLLNYSVFSISTIECLVENQQCSSQLQQEVESQLLGKSFFITDFSRELNSSALSVISFSKKIPGTVTLQVQAQQPLRSATISTTNLNQQQISDLVSTTLAEADLSIESVTLDEDDNLVIIQMPQLQVITTANNLEVDLQKIVLIVQNLDLDTIDLAIVELDVRYKLPVLRTTKTQF